MTNVFPSEEEIEQAVDLLIDHYGISVQALTALMGKQQRDEINAVLKQVHAKTPNVKDLSKFLILRKGSELFAGSSQETKSLRLKLLTLLDDEVIKGLFLEFKPSEKGINSPSHMRKPLAEIKWHDGGNWPRAFVDALGFPEIFAGVKQRKSVPTYEDLEPQRSTPDLALFQKSLKSRMLEVLEQESLKRSCIVTLPTGGGKTRIAVEAFIEWMHKRFADGKYMVWIAQSEELCEQALECIKHMWQSREYVEALRVYRYYGGRNIPEQSLKGGVVVASIHQLYKRLESKDPVVETILSRTGAMIMDEAHCAVTGMYDLLLDEAIRLCGDELFPFCGLTATPGRSGFGEERANQIEKLVDRFSANLIKPDLGEIYENDPLKYFRDNGYLARPRHLICSTHKEYELTDEEIDRMKFEDDLPSQFRNQLAWDRDRNTRIIEKLLSIPTGFPTLVYGCTVEHAYLLATILNASGKRAAAISSDTPLSIRRGAIHGFKEGVIQYLCNYGVLTTGFDAPKAECIAICRPTTSEVLYEQIVGRGLRGPAFGGTEECLIIDFADNIQRLGRPLAYARFNDFWESEAHE